MARNRKVRNNLLAALFWLAVWQIAAMAVNTPLLLVSPFAVLQTLGELVFTAAFWQTIAFSTLRILAGFGLAMAVGILLAAFAAYLPFIKILLHPLIVTVKNIPVASFIILALLWLRGTSLLSVCISFLMALPLVYANTLAGIAAADAKLLEMGRVFHLSASRRVRYLYTPAALPFVRTAGSVSMGMCWKSGVAAEVIGIVSGSIGASLYEAKILFSTAALFAWTLVIVLVSLALEQLFLRIFDIILHIFTTQGVFSSCAQPLTGSAAHHTSGITLHSATKQFGEQTVLNDLSVAFKPGESVCVMGASGLGKTTLLRVCMGLEPLNAGRVETEPGAKFSCAFQEDRLAPQLSAAANIGLVCGVTRETAVQTLARLGLAGEDLVKPSAQLSGGQQRRVSLARAMLAQTDIVLLDEPFQGLDDASRAQAAAFLCETKQNRTLIAVTHNAHDATALHARILQLTGAEEAISTENGVRANFETVCNE